MVFRLKSVEKEVLSFNILSKGLGVKFKKCLFITLKYVKEILITINIGWAFNTF